VESISADATQPGPYTDAEKRENAQNFSPDVGTEAEAPDLSGLVSKPDERPVFSSHYSEVSIG